MVKWPTKNKSLEAELSVMFKETKNKKVLSVEKKSEKSNQKINSNSSIIFFIFQFQF